MMLITLLFCSTISLSANEINLVGDDVIHYNYPENFEESKRYIRKGIKNPNGDCEFSNKRRLKPGQRIFTKELAYNPYTCESLIIEGLYTDESKKKN